MGRTNVPGAFRVVVGEAVVERHGDDVPARAGVKAVERDDVADDEFAHGGWTILRPLRDGADA